MTRRGPNPEQEAVSDVLKAARNLLAALAGTHFPDLCASERDALRQAFVALDKINPVVR